MMAVYGVSTLDPQEQLTTDGVLGSGEEPLIDRLQILLATRHVERDHMLLYHPRALPTEYDCKQSHDKASTDVVTCSGQV